MKALRLLALALIVILLGLEAQAQLKLTETENTKLFMTLHTVGTAQALDHKNAFNGQGTELAKVSPGFQNAFGDLGFIAKFGKKEEITVVFDMYLSSRNHPSQTYGNGGLHHPARRSGEPAGAEVPRADSEQGRHQGRPHAHRFR